LAIMPCNLLSLVVDVLVSTSSGGYSTKEIAIESLELLPFYLNLLEVQRDP